MHDWRADVRARLSAMRLHPQDEAEMVEEIADHLESQFRELSPRIGEDAARDLLVAQLREAGLDAAAAGRRHRARPGPTHHWGSSNVLLDIRHGLRSLRRTPGVLATGVAALGLGIGLTTGMFSVVYGLLIKGLPFEDPSRIAMIYRADLSGRGEEDLVPFGDFVRYRASQRAFTAFGGYTQATASVSGGDRPERVNAARMTAAVFDVAGVRAAIGRTFADADNAPDAPPTAVIGHAMWRDRFRADPGVIGRSIRVNGRPYAIIGVMPEGYQFPNGQQIWLPVQLDAATARPGEGAALTIVARLRRGATLESANAELSQISRRLARDLADSGATRTLAQPFVRGVVPTRVYSLLYAMLTAVFLVLLIACANVANLLLDRAANRAREVGIRVALGASRAAVIRQSLVESSIVATLAAIVGTLLAQAGIVAFNRATVYVQADTPFWADVRLHVPVLLFVLVVALAASILSGVLPAIHSANVDVSAILKDESHTASSLRVGRLSRGLVVAEIALSSALLLAAGFLTKSIVQTRMINPGFTTANVFTARVTPTLSDTLRQRQFFERLDRDLEAIPGMEGVYLGDGLPGTEWHGTPVALEGRVYARERDRPLVRRLAVSSGFFKSFGVGMLRGRAILASDRFDSPGVAVVSDVFARRLFAGADPIGRRIRLDGASGDDAWLTIVGVMPTLYAESMHNPWAAEVLTPLWQQRRISSAAVALRGPAAVANATSVRRVVAAIDRDVPVYATSTMGDVLARSMWPIRVFGTMFVIFGVASLVLAAIGLYAVMSFSVSRRVREMGIRLSLGATNGDVIRLVCREGAVQIGVGMSLGLLLGSALVRVARAVLFQVQPGDLSVFAMVGAVLGGAALTACIIPAIRATRVDPVIALRSE